MPDTVPGMKKMLRDEKGKILSELKRERGMRPGARTWLCFGFLRDLGYGILILSVPPVAQIL